MSTGPELQSKGIEAGSFEELADKAIAAIKNRGVNLEVVCGPITTGGTNNQMHNFQVFNATIRGLEREGIALFDQTPYEFGLRRLAHKWEAAGNTGYCMPILDTFYARVFESRRISGGRFIPGWHSSFGCRWEREKLSVEKCSIRDLTHADVRRFLLALYEPGHVAVIMSQLAA